VDALPEFVEDDDEPLGGVLEEPEEVEV